MRFDTFIVEKSFFTKQQEGESLASEDMGLSVLPVMSIAFTSVGENFQPVVWMADILTWSSPLYSS